MDVGTDRRAVAAIFDARAAGYAGSDWHGRCADRLVAVCPLRPGDRVLDAATGTGLAALAAARVVGPAGSVCGVDISTGMLREARAALNASGLTNVELQAADATSLQRFDAAAFDAVLCAQGLLYMSPPAALLEWHRLLKPGGHLAFSSMAADSPPPARIFRECAAAFGVSLPDPSAPLGSTLSCRTALERAGFAVVNIVSEAIEFSAHDLTRAWDSNLRSAWHGGVRRLGEAQQAALRRAYEEALAAAACDDPAALHRASILYAIGRR